VNIDKTRKAMKVGIKQIRPLSILRGALMNIRKTLSILSFTLALSIMLPVLRADEWNQATRFTSSQPVQIPGRVLPAGTYVFQLVDNNHHLVQILAEDRTILATIYSIPRQRNERNDKVSITLAHRGGAQPEAIVAWFFVGEPEGHEFLYPKKLEQELVHAV
jgi:hypothetical protein